MTSRPTCLSPSRGGFSTGDLVLGLAALSLLVALAWPWVRHAAFLDRVESVVGAVETARAAVEAHRAEHGSLPPEAPAGRIPDALRPYLSPEAAFTGEGYALELRQWVALEAPPPQPAPPEEDPDELVSPSEGELPLEPPPDSVPTPTPTARSLALLSVHSADSALLAALLENYGSGYSFVQDTVWTLVFPWAGPP